MRIGADHYVNGERPTGGVEQRQCVEARSADGAVWANVCLDEGEILADVQIVTAEGADPVSVDIAPNPSGNWLTVPLEPGAQVSARAGYPRLILLLEPA